MVAMNSQPKTDRPRQKEVPVWEASVNQMGSVREQRTVLPSSRALWRGGSATAPGVVVAYLWARTWRPGPGEGRPAAREARASQ